jgi:hypothetical protein
MCDYSLGGLPNRLAKEGDELVVHKFRTGSMGLAAAADLKPVVKAEVPRKSIWEHVRSFLESEPRSNEVCAVCIPPGAKLTLISVPAEVQARWTVTEGAEVVFTQTSALANTYRDAILMPDGRTALLQCLPEGMRVNVVSLGGTEEAQEARKEETYV